MPPTREGRLHAVDVDRLKGMHAALSTMFNANVRAQLKDVQWGSTTPDAVLEAVVTTAAPVSIIDLREPIEQGQRVSQWLCEMDDGSGWREVARGTTIGYRALRRISPIAAKRVRVRILDSVERPLQLELHLYSPTS